jgi:hypothetical protein
MIRNYLSFNLARLIGEYASRTIFCEVMINGDYKGLYLLLEKIKPGRNRVDIHEIGPDDNSYPDITGGYITKSDKTTGGDPVAWYMSSYNWTNDVQFIHDKPEPEDVTSLQNQYIQSQFLKLGHTAHFRDQSLETGYPSVIDIPSFVDYMLLTELAANADGYHLSTFYHKDRNGKLRAGPLWDMDLTYGNDLFLWGFDRSKTNIWQFANGDNDGPMYWKDLFENSKFNCYLSRRWNQLVQSGQPFDYHNIEQLIDQVVTVIGEAVIRENQRWGTVGDHAANIAAMKNFIRLRINWITNNIGSYYSCSDPDIPQLVITKIMYAPDSTAMFPVSKDQEFIEIQNIGAERVNLTGIYFGGTGFVYEFPVNSWIDPGESKILAGNSEVFTRKYGFLPSGQFTRNLSDDGEILLLLDGFGNVIDMVQYSDQPPWPDVKNNGLYLSLPDPMSDNSLGSNWVASTSGIVTVRDIQEGPELKLYPLPVNEILYIESDRTISYVELYDISGIKLKRIAVNAFYANVDMSARPRGIYLVKIICGGASSVKKVIKE